jgi:predicted RNA methylase
MATHTVQKKGLARNTIDKYYTDTNVVKMLIQHVVKHIDITNKDLVIEPSAGNGAFINSIKLLCENYVFYDIEPDHKDIIQQDYLKLDASNLKKFNRVHIVGNPPFGRQSSLAIKFIKKSCEFCDTISFILPKSFKKDSLKSKFDTNFHLKCEIDVPDNSFLVNSKPHDVPCVFQIWKKCDEKRAKVEKLTPKNFTFVNKEENPDVSFRRVGVNAGVISKDIINKSKQSHYFITFTNKTSIDDTIAILQKIRFKDSGFTVGPKSISKQELIKEFNDVIQ